MTLLETYKQILAESVSIADLIEAIEYAQVIRFYYKGDKTIRAGFRSAEVYALGESKAGNKVLRAFQIRGVTDTVIPEWKLFRVDKMSKLEFVRSFKRARSGFNPKDDRTMIRVDKIVEL